MAGGAWMSSYVLVQTLNDRHSKLMPNWLPYSVPFFLPIKLRVEYLWYLVSRSVAWNLMPRRFSHVPRCNIFSKCLGVLGAFEVPGWLYL